MATQTKTEESIVNAAISAVGAKTIRGFSRIKGILKQANTVITLENRHNFQVGDTIYFWGVSRMSEINGTTGTITALDIDSKTITTDIDTSSMQFHDAGTGVVVQNTEEGKLVAQRYIEVQDDTMGDHLWNFLVRREKLTNPTLPLNQAQWSGQKTIYVMDASIRHDYLVGDVVEAAGFTGSDYNGTFRVIDDPIIAQTSFAVDAPIGNRHVISDPVTPFIGITQANPAVFTVVNHGFTASDTVDIAVGFGMTEMDGKSGVVTVISADTFSIPVDSTGFTAWSANTLSFASIEVATELPATGKATVKYAGMWGFSDAYKLPDDFLELIGLDDKVEDFRIEGNKIFSNASDMNISYLAKIQDPSKWPQKFATAVSARLAAEIAIKLTGSLTKYNTLLQVAQRRLEDAMYHDSRQDGPNSLSPTEWVNARLGDTQFRKIDVTPQSL